MTTETALLPDPSPQLEQAFRATATRMSGLGFVNPALSVEAVAFEPWDGYWLGVMVTPWSINLLLLPRDRSLWRTVRAGDKQRYAFPAGDYDFIAAMDPVVGEYQMCSLFSPALEFEDHATARMVAKLAREALFDVDNAEQPDAGAATDEISQPGPLARMEQQAGAPMSKRDFLRGRFLRADGSNEPGS
jgi:[NiFe] hydrogenase assembly HybE family chaperone